MSAEIAPIPWHFTPQPADLPIEQFRERLFWGEQQRYHVLGVLIESPGTDEVKRFIQQHRQP